MSHYFEKAPSVTPDGSSAESKPRTVDSFGRLISYARISVTDRCDLRCRYCMTERMSFQPREDLLELEEIVRLADLLIARGISRIRLTGGEPLVRKGIDELVRALGRRLGSGLDELTLTTNGTQLVRYASDLAAAGIRRVNVSMDSRDPDRFEHITRRGGLHRVLAGIKSAAAAGLKVKINMVALKHVNDDEIGSMLRWCASEGHDLTLIETMPLGEVEGGRSCHYLPLTDVRENLEREFELVPLTVRTGGPARYFDVVGLDVRVGLITPLTNNFCQGCNRIRIASTGTVYGCLGHDQKVELRDLLRARGTQAVHDALDELLAGKPKAHQFQIQASRPAVQRHMSATGG